MFQFIGRRRPAVAGLIVGGSTGLVAAIAYGATSGWLCSGIRNCPASWVPYAWAMSIIFVVTLVFGAVVATVGARLYRIFDTALGGGGGTFVEDAPDYVAPDGGGDTTSSERSDGEG